MRNRKSFFYQPRFLTISTLLCSVVFGLSSFVNTPADFLTDLQAKYERFVQKYPVVKISMAFNQPAYAPGDTIFFKAWYQTELRSAVNGTHIITLDIVSGQGKTLQKTKFKVKDGSGFNQIILDNSFEPGLYKVVGYSDWMRNFGESWYYISDLVITRNKNISVIAKSSDKKLQFFAEGGNAMAGVQNRFVGIGPASIHAMVLDNFNKQTVEIVFDSTGVSLFEFTPEAGNAYHVLWENKTWALPPSEPDGINLHLNANASIVHLTLPPNSKLSGDDFFAIELKNGKIILKKSFSIHKEQTFDLSLAQDNSDGFNQLFVFDRKGDVLASRIFLPIEEKKFQVKIQLPEKLDQRSEVAGTISVTDRNGNGIESDLTVSVFQQDLFGPSTASLFYRSDLPEVDRYFNKHKGKSVVDVNNFLITQNWDRLNWETILSGKGFEIVYPFNSQFGLKGQVLAKAGISAIPDSTTVIAYLQENTIGYEGYTRNGRFVIPFVLDFFGKDQVFFTLQNKTRILDEDYEISIQNDSVNLFDRWETKETAIPSMYGTYAMKRGIVSRSYSFFEKNNQESSKNIENPNRFFEDEFLGTDFTVNVSEYVIFPTMIELVREVVPFVQHRKKKSGDELRLSYRRENTTHVFSRDPLYIMDGAMTRNTAFFLSLKPEDLLYFKLINNPNKLSQLGKLGENGIIFIESKKGDLASKIIVKNYFQATGISRAIPFPVKTGAREKEKRPDLRSTLYWNPSLKITQSGTTNLLFSTSDDIGPMKIVVKGFTKEGIAFTAEEEIFVEIKNQMK